MSLRIYSMKDLPKVSLEEVREQVFQHICIQVQDPHLVIKDEDYLHDLGMDSLDVVELEMALEDHYGNYGINNFLEEVEFDSPNVAKIVELLHKALYDKTH